jgi:hypothetical protein
MRLAITLCLLLPLAGCGLLDSRAAKAQRNSPDYKAGYNDGCSSAAARGVSPRATGMVRDEESYRTNPDYRAGWGTGFNGCRIYQPSQGPAAGRGPIPDPY